MTKAAAPKPDPVPPKDPEADNNLRLWLKLGKSDPRHTKPITGRGFDGTALKPMWQNMRMTEIFGPVGQGWGMSKPDYETFTAGDTILVYCTVRVWYKDPASGEEGEAYGVGGDVIAGVRNNGKKFHDDEALKKAYTDALGNAFKFIGVAADIHMGMFDDSKYVADLKAEFMAADDELGKRADALQDQIRECTSLDTLVNDLLPVAIEVGNQLTDAKRGGEQAMLVSVFNARKAALKKATKDDALAHEPTEPADQA